MAIIGLNGCADNNVLALEPAVPAEFLYAIQVSPRGITMAVGEQIPLIVTPVNFLGEPMVVPDSAPVRIVSLDTTRVQVTPTGALHAVQPTSIDGTGPVPVPIIATWSWGTRTKTDTVYAAVTATAPSSPVTSLQLHVDSTWASFGGRPVRVSMSARTADGSDIPNIFAYLSSPSRASGVISGLNYTSAIPRTREVQGTMPQGRYWVYAMGMIYGTPVKDSLEFVSLDPIGVGINGFIVVYYRWIRIISVIGSVSNVGGADLSVAPCAPVQFISQVPDSIRITFANTQATRQCVAGDVAGDIAFDVGTQVGVTHFRKFAIPGEYVWTATRKDGTPFSPPVTGKILVRDHTMFGW